MDGRLQSVVRSESAKARPMFRYEMTPLPTTTLHELDHYQLLGVSYEATPTEITRAYRAMMKRCHPDKLSPELRSSAEEQCRILNGAYRTLSKPETKAQYDQQLKAVKVQEQIMSRYGEGLGGAEKDIYSWIREMQQEEQRKLRRQSDRQATSSLLIVFAGFVLLVFFLFMLGNVAGSLLHRLG